MNEPDHRFGWNGRGKTMQCSQCRNLFIVIGKSLNSQVNTVQLLEQTAETIVKDYQLKGCHFRLLSRDQKIL
jgi:hypothetical protein